MSEWTVYMLCYAEPIGDPDRPRCSAQHYVGKYTNRARIGHHENGTSGVNIVTAFHSRGIPFIVSRTVTTVDGNLERKIKNAGQHRRHCPRCTPNPWTGGWGIATQSAAVS